MRRVLLAILAAALGGALGYAASRVALGDRHPAPTVVEQPGGRALIRVHVELANETAKPRHYTITVAEPLDVTLRSARARWQVEPDHRATVPVDVEVPAGWFARGPRTLYLRIDSEDGTQRIASVAVGGR